MLAILEFVQDIKAILKSVVDLISKFNVHSCDVQFALMEVLFDSSNIIQKFNKKNMSIYAYSIFTVNKLKKKIILYASLLHS